MACASKPMVDIYDIDSKIADNSNSYNLINCEQRIEEQNYKCSIEKFEGMDTVWTYDAAEDVSAELSFFVSVYDGKMKLVLIAPDDSLTTIAEITPETKLEDPINYTINLKKGKNRIKVVAGIDTKLELYNSGLKKLYLCDDIKNTRMALYFNGLNLKYSAFLICYSDLLRRAVQS